MADIAQLGLKIDSKDVIKATKRLDKLEEQGKKNEKQAKKTTSAFKGMGAAITAIAGSLLIRKFVQTAGAFESMAISLEVVTGSAEKASMAMAGITEFAKNTPFQVSEITDAFIKLKALGIEPTEASLRSFGNTSSAMGKSLNQMIEAVADASTFEFERLKEFGIKARQQADSVTFTFQGITTKVGKNAKEITEFLESIGREKFGGAMIKQMDTINGKISNLGDSFDQLIVTFSQAGGGEGTKGALDLAIDGVNALTDGIKILPGLFVALFGEVDIFFTEFGARAETLKAVLANIFSPEKAQKEALAIRENADLEIKAIQDTVAAFIEGEQRKADARVSEGGITEAGKTEIDPVKVHEDELDRLFEADILYFDKQARIIEMEDERDAIKREKAEAELEFYNDYYERLFDMQTGSFQAGADFAEAIRDGDTKSALQNGSLMLSNMAKTNKAAFEVQKAFALANAIVTLPSAVMKSFDNGGGYPWGLIPAGLMLAQGLSQISAIQSTSFGSKSSSGGGIGGGSTSPSAPVASGLPPGSTAVPDGAEVPTQQVSITLNGAGYSRDDVRELIDSINEEIGDGATLVAA